MGKFLNRIKIGFIIPLMCSCLWPLGIYARNTRVIKNTEEIITVYKNRYTTRHITDDDTIYKISVDTAYKVTMTPLHLQLYGNFDGSTRSWISSNKSIYEYMWSRKITLSLPKGIKRLYRYPEIIVKYNSGAVVWVCVTYLENSSSAYNINARYKDGVYNPTCSFIDSLADAARTLEASRRLLGENIGTYIAYMRLTKQWFKTWHVFYDFKDNRLKDKRGYSEERDERLLSCLTPAKRSRKAILSVKDGIFVLAYNIPARDYPMFDACIRNTFCIKNRLLEYIDIKDDDGISEEGLKAGWRNLTKKFYLYYRLYKELPTVTPPDSDYYRQVIFDGITTEPDTFLLARPKNRCSD